MADTGAAHSSLASRIAALVHTYYNGLPNGSKPVVNDDGTGQWIPMSAIVLVKGGGSALWVVFGESSLEWCSTDTSSSMLFLPGIKSCALILVGYIY